MCGVFCILDNNLSLSLEKKINALYSFRHRGPDNTSYKIINNLFLGHHRLSIRDLSLNSNQPKYCKNKRFLISYNGEIYNFKELHDELKNQNIFINNNSDTELLVNYIAAFGIKKTLQSINGMYAFICFDSFENKLYCARDPFGEKPLYVYSKNYNFIISSDLKSFHNLGLDLEISKKSLDLFLRLSFIPSPDCIYTNIKKISPGECITINNKNLNFDQCEKFTFFNSLDLQIKNSNDENISKNLIKNKLIESVESQLVSDVEVGTLLSGGIDSSLITAIASKIKPKISTFTIGFNEKNYDESIYAKEIADYLGLRNYSLEVGPSDLINSIDLMPDIYSEPFADSSQIPTYILTKFCREKIKVALTGDGGDELFGGYNRYIYFDKYRSIIELPEIIKIIISKFIKFLPINSLIKNKIQNKVLKVHDLKSYYIAMIDTFDLVNSSVYDENNDISDLFKNFFDLKMDAVTILQQMDIKYYLPDDILVKTDRASMFNGLETRAPFLSKDIHSLSLSLKSSQKITFKNSGKIILKQILNDYIPSNLFNRPKRGFGIPLSSWIKGDLSKLFLSILDNKKNDLPLRKDYFKIIFENHISNKRDNSSLLWNYLMFQKWYEKYH